MHPKCPLRSSLPTSLFVVVLAVLAALGTALAGQNPDVTFLLHAQSISAGGCNATGQPDCVTDQPTVNVPASTQQRIFVYANNVSQVAGVQTAFRWDPSWELLGSSWNCQANQITATSPDPATNGGPTDGTVATAFDCRMDTTMVLIGYMDFDVGTSGCLEQVQSSYPFGNHVIDCTESVDAFDADDPIQALRFGRVCVDVGGRNACVTPPADPEPPFVTFSPEPVDFGAVTVGHCGYATATISNLTPGVRPDLIINEISELTGIPFQIDDMPPLPVAVYQGTSISIDLSYCPLSEGPAAGELVISSNALNSPYVVSLIGVGTSSPSSPISVSWNFPVNSLALSPEGAYEVASVEGAESMPYGSEPFGFPHVPVYQAELLLPFDHRIREVTTTLVTETQDGTHVLFPNQPWPEHHSSAWVPPDSAVYASPVPYPAEVVEVEGDSWSHGYHIASLRIHPVQFIGATSTVTLNTTVSVTAILESVPADELAQVAPRLRADYKPSFKNHLQQSLAERVSNPEDIERFYGGRQTLKASSPTHRPYGGFLPSEKPSLDSPPVEYVIVTTEELEDEFEELADWKTRTGIPTVIRTVSWIDAHYPGVDPQERIRNFIRDAYSLWGTRYALLGGDTQAVPDRVFQSTGLKDPPVDFYYAALDNTFNADRDIDFDSHGGDSDSEVFVGRAPVNTPEEASTFVNKVLTYARAPGHSTIPSTGADYHQSLLLLAGLTNSYGENDNNGIWSAEHIREESQAPSVTRLYEDVFFDSLGACTAPTNDPCSADSAKLAPIRGYLCGRSESSAIREACVANRLNQAGMLEELSAGHGYVFHFEHSAYDRLGGVSGTPGPPCIRANGPSQPRQLVRGIVRNIAADHKYGIFMSFGCDQNAVDKESVSEYLMRLPDGGAVAYLAKTRSPGTYRILAGDFFRSCFDKTSYTDLGKAAYFAIDQEPAGWYQLLLGDPTMPLFSAAPTSLEIAGSGLATTLAPGRHTLEFEVTEDGQAVDGALVCLTQDGVGEAVGSQLYRFAETQVAAGDSVGRVVFDIHLWDDTPVRVTATAANAAPDTASIPVNATPAVGSEIVYVSHDLGSLADGSGSALAGETGAVEITVENLGPTDASSVAGVLSSWGRIEFDFSIETLVEFELLDQIFIGSEARNPVKVPFTLDELMYAGIAPEGSPLPNPLLWGFFLWRDPVGEQWHLRWRGSAVGMFGFSGTIQSSGGINGVTAVGFEAVGDSVASDGTKITFEGSSMLGDEDGLDIRAEDWNNVYADSTQQSFGSIDSSVTASAGFNLEVRPGAEDRHEALLQLQVLEGGVPGEFSLFSVPLAAPKLETVAQRPIVRANSDTVDLYIVVRNRGTRTADAASVTIAAEEKATVLVDSLAAGTLAPGDEIEVGPFVVLQQTSDPDSVQLAVTQENTYPSGDKVSWPRSGVDLGPPVGVAFVQAFPGAGGNLTRWDEPGSGIAGYNVYRKPVGTATSTRVNDSLVVEATSFFDTFDFGGESYAHEEAYQYEVRAVDASWNESEDSEEVTVKTWLKMAPGWPQEIDVPTHGSVLVADIDGDGDKEILHAGGAVYAWHHDGTEVVDGDGDSTTTGIFYNAFKDTLLEGGRRFINDLAVWKDELIVGASWGDTTYFWNPDGSLIDRKHVQGDGFGGATFASPLIEDLNGDGKPEILVSTHRGVLHSWTFDASSSTVTAYATDDSTAFPTLTSFVYGGPAVGQLDGDGALEVVYVTKGANDGDPNTVSIQEMNRVWALDNALDGSGQPLTTSLSTSDTLWTRFYDGLGMPGTPRLANIDGDSPDEVLVVLGQHLFVIDDDGSFMWQQLVSTGVNQQIRPPAVMDLDSDGVHEKIIVGDGKGNKAVWTNDPPWDQLHGQVVVHAFDSDSGVDDQWILPGQRHFIAETTQGVRSPCTVVDADLDGDLEVVHGTELHQIVVWDAATGALEPGWPIVLRETVRGRVTVADIDGDGRNEVIASDHAGLVYVWEYGEAVTGTSEADESPVPAQHWLGLSRPNPFNPFATIPYAVARAGKVRIRVYDVAGRLVRELVSDHREPGTYEVSWNGRDARGGVAGSGVYFYELQVDGRQVGSRKFVMIR